MSYRGRRGNNGNRNNSGSMAVDNSSNGGKAGDQGVITVVELRNWEGGTMQDVINFIDRKTRVRLTNPRQSGGLITAQAGPNDANTLQRLNGVRFSGASLNIKATKQQNTSSTAISVLTSVLDARYDAATKMLNFARLMEDPVLRSNGLLDNATTATKMFQALIKMAHTKTSGNVVSVTLEGNSLVNGEIVLHLAQTFPSLQNLSLANNQIADIQSLAVLRNKLPMLRELVLAGNPIQQMPSFQAQIPELLAMFRRLLVIDGVPVRSENDLPALALPAPVKQTFFEDEMVASMTPMFLSNFFGFWDTNRQGLIGLYDDASFFSLCYNGGAPHVVSSNKRGSTHNPYLDFSRNLLRNSSAKSKYQRFSVGPRSISSAFGRLPASKHDLNNVQAFAIDSWKISNVRTPGDTAVLMVVHGEFVETNNNQKRSFDRSLVVLPGANGSYIVASDMLNIRLFGVLPKPGDAQPAGPAPQASAPQAQPPQQPPQAHSAMPPAQQQQQIPLMQPGAAGGGIPPLNGLAPGGGAPPPLDPAAVIQEIMRRTRLKAEYAEMCAQQSNYQLEAALQLFEQFRSQLPPDAFA